MRIRWITFLLTVVMLAACGTGEAQRRDSTSGPLNDPPKDAEQGSVPEGPDVILPEDERPEPAEKVDGPSVTRAEVDAFMEKGPPYVLTVVTVKPHRDENGGFTGYQIVDVSREARAFMMPQLQVGDVVTHVNGVRQSKPDDLTNAWKALRQVDRIRIDFTRQGKAGQASWSIR